ncbi:UDP-N-acetylglucosamine--undecaprenyl-phosphate N-acetylglucosaminephosphotransferase [Photobacterium kishitanii]|uniref:UDP-N-acetylglucosamine--undecaprenyl-phosphate N-acetylglucosaminephosphotransferase n=1 Tax=Photobacterium kishitanii TaxID=318456 RepID=UPI000D15B23C|nr:UDP-N-acetylglucosamine--undecaprenyl-phosphate N-acetylglucosaminephosphotransferase [Photobacterium kishitanii]PSU22926.1 undecaprenyl-phosphate alpha-N-acetylglucosaminyl 1-phosphate transferase [Photobacterium kishitanii]
MEYSYIFVFVLSFVSLFIMRKVAKKVGLVDKPNARKHHQGVIPLVGGIAVFIAFAIAALLFLPVNVTLLLYLGCGLILLAVGVIDDYLDISFKIRLVVQAGIALAIISVGGHSLDNLGYLMGSETLQLSPFIGGIVTVVAFIGAINAFNMVDGIDGLLGGLASVTFTAMGYVFYTNGNPDLALFCGLLVAAMLPYIMLNLGLPFGRRFKVFMGDVGSVFIGFTVVWLLVRGTQEADVVAFQPVTALWLIAIPLMDMATIMIRRVRKGQSPFKPDREHLHHICQRIGLSSRMTLVVIYVLAICCAAIGIWCERLGVKESTMFIAFLVMFGGYFMMINHIWRITAAVKRLFGIPTVHEA